MGERARVSAFVALVVVLAAPAAARATHAASPTAAWGYEAAGSNARLLEYDIASDTVTASCVPPDSVNGRGVEFDPIDGNLWYTVVRSGAEDFRGDGFIHKATRPPACAFVDKIPFGDGPGGSVQDAIGAIEVSSDGQLWAAGYQPIGGRSFLYKVDHATGAVLASCSVPFGGGGAGNDTLTEVKRSDLPGSGSYLLTDAGEGITNPNALLAVDEASCAGGGAGTVVASFDKVKNVTGIDAYSGKLLATDEVGIFDLTGPAYATVGAGMLPRALLEDISVQSNRAPDCSNATVSPDGLFPPNHKFVTVAIADVTDPDGDPVTVSMAGVTQDEPVLGSGDNTAPDAAPGPASNQVQLRAERSPQGDGRIYRISFRASDPQGASCSGNMTVSVQKQPNAQAVDSAPPSFNSFG